MTLVALAVLIALNSSRDTQGSSFRIDGISKKMLLAAIARGCKSGLLSKEQKRAFKDEIIACKDGHLSTLAESIVRACL